MFQGLEQAITKTFKEVTMTFNGSGKLTYKIGFSVGPIQKDHQFTIDLQEKNNDALTIFEKKVEDRFGKLSQRISNIEGNIPLQNGNGHHHQDNNHGDFGKRFDSLEKRVDLLEKKMTEIEQTKVSRAELQNIIDAFSKLESKVLKGVRPAENEPLSEDLSFDLSFYNIFAKDFEFFNDKGVKYSGSKWIEVPLSNPLPSKGVFKLNLRLLSVPKHIWFGIVDQDLMKFGQGGWFEKNYFYSTKDGSICFNGKHMSVMKNFNENKGKTGDLLTFIIDVEMEIFSIQVNEVEVNSAKINLGSKTYFPYCGLLNKNCAVSMR